MFLFWLWVLLVLNLLLPNAVSYTFQDLIPQHLRSGFSDDDCPSIEDPGKRGVCELLSATSTQIQLLNATSISTTFQSSCKYKEQNGASHHRYASDRSPVLESLLHRYAEMHRRCLETEYASLEELVKQRNISPRCRYLVWSCTFGLGNRLMSLVSAFLYALLSQRVLLVDDPGWNQLFCQPFVGSSWYIPAKFSTPRNFDDSFSNYYDGHWKKKNKNKNKNKSPKATSNVTLKAVPVFFTSTTKLSEHRFLVCPSALASVRDVPFLNFRNSNQYYAPGFFLNPVLRPVLESLFPDNKVFHDLGRFLINPSDPVWERIRNMISPRPFTRRFGVQLRDFAGRYTDYFDRTVPLCIRDHLGICPIEMEERKSNLSSDGGAGNPNLTLNSSPGGDLMSVYVATIIGGHVSKINGALKSMEAELPGVEFVTSAQPPDGKQLDDPSHQQKALVDIWLLSLSDVLMTTGASTFGYVAQGLAGVTPLRITHWKSDPCLAAVSSDPCFHFAPKAGFRCEDDGFAIGDGASRGLEYAWACRDMTNSGLQLGEL